MVDVFLGFREVQRKKEVGDLYVIDSVGLCLDSVAQLVPVIDESAVFVRVRMRALHESVHLGIQCEFQRFMGQCHAPGLAEHLRQGRKHEAIWNASVGHGVVPKGVGVGLVGQQIDDGIAAHVERAVRVQWVAGPSFQAQFGMSMPVASEVFLQLPVDSAQGVLDFLVAELGVVDDGDDHAELVRLRVMGGIQRRSSLVRTL